MRCISILTVLLLLFGCSDDDIDSSNIVGTWKLAQVLADPGDGSGTFVDVESTKTIIFLSDNTFSSNGNLCSFNPFEERTTNGTFSIQEEKILPGGVSCGFLSQVQVGIDYKIENGALIIYYFCIEGCAEKYVKIE